MNVKILKEYFSIPNLLGYLRIILLPIYFCLYLNEHYYIAAGLMIFSFLTDTIDGKIARKYNMVTEFGKMLDPVADKLTQGVIAISLCFHYPPMIVLVVVFLAKEMYMIICGILLLGKGFMINGAQMHGKVCTVVLDIVICAAMLFNDLPEFVIIIMVIIGCAFMLYSFGRYFKIYRQEFRRLGN